MSIRNSRMHEMAAVFAIRDWLNIARIVFCTLTFTLKCRMHATECSGRWHVYYGLRFIYFQGVRVNSTYMPERMLSIQLISLWYQEAIRPRFKRGMSAD